MKHRKFYSVLVFILLASMVLAACAPAAPAETPAATVPPVEEPTAVMTEAPVEEPTEVMTEEPEATEAPTETEAPSEALASFGAESCDYGGKVLSIEAIDELTVRFNLCKPDPAFLAKVAFVPFAIYPSE